MIVLHQYINGSAVFFEPDEIVQAGTRQQDGDPIHYIVARTALHDIIDVREEPVAIAFLKKTWRDIAEAEKQGDSAVYAVALSAADDMGRFSAMVYGPADDI